MKKTIKTGLMIALFAVCIFLLLPFVITERTHEQQDEQLRTAQPQVYSSNPLTSFFQRAKDLLASHSGRGDKKTAAARKQGAKAKEIARGAQKLSAKGPESLAAQRPVSGDSPDASGSSSSTYTPKNYDFALYESVRSGAASDGTTPAAQMLAHNPLFLADEPENAPAKNGIKNPAYAKNKTLASAKKSARSFPVGYSLGGVGATAGALGVNAGRSASRAALPANTDTAKILQDIARMRANAKYPNPQTEAERLAREEFMRKERERYQRELNRLYWNSVLHPQNPQDQPDIEDFEKDVLGKIIIDTTGSNTIKSLNFVSDPADEQEQDPQEVAQIKQDILQQQLAKNGLNLQDLSKEEQDFLLQDLPIIVNLGTTTNATWEEIAQEIHRLNAEQTDNEQQAVDHEGQEDSQQAETQATPKKDPKAQKYQEFLEQFLWLYTEAGCDTQDCSWLAADPNTPRLKHLKKGAALANSHVVGDPLGLQKQFWEKYKDKVQAETKKAQNQQKTEYQDEEDEEIAAEMQELEQIEAVTTAAGSFVEFANYIPYNEKNMEEVKGKFLNNTADEPEADNKQQKALVLSANAYHTQNVAQKGIDYDSLLTSNPSLEELTTLELVAGAIDQAKIDHLEYRENAAGLIQDETKKASQEIIKQNLEQNKTTTSGKNK